MLTQDSICVVLRGAMLVCGVTALVGLATALLVFVHHRVRQLPLRKLNGPPIPSLWLGHYRQMFNPASPKFHDYFSKTYGTVARLYAFLGDTQLLISDTRACHHILVKDAEFFEQPAYVTEANRHSFGPSILATHGAQHRRQRKQLTPAFSIKNMRTLAPLFQELARQCRCMISSKLDEDQEIDILDPLNRLAIELIAQGGLGYSFGSFDGRQNEFGRAMRSFGPTIIKLAVWRSFLPVISTTVPAKLMRSIATLLPWTTMHNLMGICDSIYKNSVTLYNEKKKMLEMGDEVLKSHITHGNDIISVLLKSNLDATESKLPDEEILAQMSMLILAATNTTSSALSRILYTLAQNPEAQDRLRSELTETRGEADEPLDYDQLVELPYLEAVCRETLRLHPPVNFITRVAQKDITIPLSQPITTTDGDTVSTLYVPRNTSIFVNIYGMNRDANIWGPDADVWKPERWLAPLPESVLAARIPGVYSNTLTFSGGGRACIGFKFSQLEMKVALAELLTHFRFSLSKHEITWRFGGLIIPSADGDIKLPMVVERV
ncbi:cytochrome P450 [Auriscalpium vulgare]|uniref:Cytochrome P450 n=1 Tax=Auriscalpium vulgare TaxID=40419 RepID=A0ACB8SC69_9AGAM|nr:cytochrome P450 [Auriscalpium vulgare]